jgi:hypothetical protein
MKREVETLGNIPKSAYVGVCIMVEKRISKYIKWNP